MNLYEEEVNFEKLTARDSDFAAVIRANGGRIDFNNPEIVKYELYLHQYRQLPALYKTDLRDAC